MGSDRREVCPTVLYIRRQSGRSYKGSDMAEGHESALKALADDRRRREEDSG